MGKIVVTGGDGFIGKHLINHLSNKNLDVTKINRETLINEHQVNDLRNIEDWTMIFKKAETVIHLAAFVHLPNKDKRKNIDLNKSINTNLTRSIAIGAAKAGVKKFIFLSSIGVLGKKSNNKKFNRNSKYNPYSDYTFSKKDAEIELLNLEKDFEMHVLIVRAPLVYGKGSRGNFKKLKNLLRYHIPLPFYLIKNNKRSYIGINNLVSFLTCLILKKNTKSDIYNISDNHDLSTYELMKKLKKYSSSKSIIFPIPINLLKIFFNLINRPQWIDSMIYSLEIDCADEMKKLNWSPPYSIEDQIKEIFYKKK